MNENPKSIENEQNSLENLIRHIVGNIVPVANFFHFYNGVLDPGNGKVRSKREMSPAEAKAACDRLKIECLARLDDGQNLNLPLLEGKNRAIIDEILQAVQGDWSNPEHIRRLNQLVIDLNPSDLENAIREAKRKMGL